MKTANKANNEGIFGRNDRYLKGKRIRGYRGRGEVFNAFQSLKRRISAFSWFRPCVKKISLKEGAKMEAIFVVKIELVEGKPKLKARATIEVDGLRIPGWAVIQDWQGTLKVFPPSYPAGGNKWLQAVEITDNLLEVRISDAILGAYENLESAEKKALAEKEGARI